MLQVEVLSYEDLTPEEQEEQPNNGWGKEYATYIKISDGASVLHILSDAVEPEDATFGRDFSDIPAVIEHAYRIGVQHGKKLAT